ncbi:MAG TPA: heme peroxidase family protein [Burkholderiaceae bacterium]
MKPKPTSPRSHGYSTSDANPVRSNLVKPGRFGLMFPELANVPWTTGNSARDDEIALELGKSMHAPSRNAGVIAAGFTYFGQFVDHDITFDPTSLGENAVDIGDLVNFRSPALDLDSLYGSGPRDQPFLYRRDSGGTAKQFLIGPVVQPGATAPGGADAQVVALDGASYDLPRSCDGISERTAIVGDKRNDENLIVAQLHRTLLHFHNALCLDQPSAPFEQIRKQVIHHYQRIVLNEFLPAVAGQAAVDAALQELRFYKIGPGQLATEPFIPLEFSGAAYRFGHSMVRSAYNFNKVFDAGTDFSLAFTFTGDGGFFGAPRYPTNWLLDWRQFFPGLGTPPQMAMSIDGSMSDKLLIGPDKIPLATLNLKRGARHYKLPPGQAVAARMGLPALTPDQLMTGAGGDVIKRFDLTAYTPLWVYVLKEAEALTGGKHLGPLGGTIVAEVIVGLLRDDPESVLNAATPELPSADGRFKIADLFNFVEGKKGQGNIPAAGVINPLGA